MKLYRYLLLAAVLFSTAALTTGCASSTTRIVNQLAEQGTFKKVQIQTKKGDKVQVEYKVETEFFD